MIISLIFSSFYLVCQLTYFVIFESESGPFTDSISIFENIEEINSEQDEFTTLSPRNRDNRSLQFFYDSTSSSSSSSSSDNSSDNIFLEIDSDGDIICDTEFWVSDTQLIPTFKEKYDYEPEDHQCSPRPKSVRFKQLSMEHQTFSSSQYFRSKNPYPLIKINSEESFNLLKGKGNVHELN